LRYAAPQQGAADLPVLDQALSAERMLDAFRRYLPPRDRHTWERCRIERVSYKPGKSSRVLYRLWQEGEPLESGYPHYYYCEFLPATRSLRRYIDLKEDGGPGEPTGFVAELDMIHWCFPADPRLAQLPSVWREGSWSVVSYTPTMSCVLAGSRGNQPAILKLYHDDRVDRVAGVMRALGAAGVAVPRVLDVDEPRRLVVLEHVPGASFWSDPDTHLTRPVMAAMARELTALHDTKLDPDSSAALEHVRHGEREWQRFQETTAELARTFPDMAPRLERLANMLGQPQEAPEPALLHGDFHPAQFLVDRGVPRLIDFDNVCYGDPMYDMARFASHLYYKGKVYERPLPEIERAVSAFRAAYIGAGTRFAADRWFWHLAVSLVAKRAHRAMTRLESSAGDYVGHLVTIAEQNAASIIRS
jgi:aminoglycoside phosphotransferase (APT) family kinase protein